jgi:hypothetical protein
LNPVLGNGDDDPQRYSSLKSRSEKAG